MIAVESTHRPLESNCCRLESSCRRSNCCSPEPPSVRFSAGFQRPLFRCFYLPTAVGWPPVAILFPASAITDRPAAVAQPLASDRPSISLPPLALPPKCSGHDVVLRAGTAKSNLKPSDPETSAVAKAKPAAPSASMLPRVEDKRASQDAGVRCVITPPTPPVHIPDCRPTPPSHV